MAKPPVNLAALAGPAQPAKVPSFATKLGTTSKAVRPGDVSANPLNTRVITNADAQAMAASLNRHGQLAACVVVTRKAFVSLFPQHANEIGTRAYVQVTGGRRLAGAIVGGRESLDVQIRDELAADALTFLGATAAENLDRENLNPIEEARAIALMVEQDGITRKDVAERLNRTGAWVTQRMNLLKLLPELQELVLSGELPVSVARDIGPKPGDEQWQLYEQWRDRHRAAAAPEPAKPEPEPEAPEPESEPDPAAPRPPRPVPQVVAIRHLGGTGPAVARSLLEHMPDEELRALVAEVRERLGI